jgi:hypothetical protein
VDTRIASPARIGLGLVAVASLALVTACGDDDDSAEATASAATTGGEDTGGEDTGGEDTGGEDTGGEDTGGEDGAEPGSYEVVSDAAVASGYGDMIAEMTQLSADPSTADEAALEGVHETWESFEGTVKQNDSDAYLASEEALDSFLDAGADQDAAAMAAATAKMSETAATYLAAHPG